MDYRKFLGRREELLLPYLGGYSVHAPGRRLRLTEPTERGFYRFEVTGRKARPLERVPALSLDDYPAVRGHVASGFLFESGKVEHVLEVLEGDAPQELSPCVARRVDGGSVVLEGVEFEGEAEDAARRALEDEGSIAKVSGAAASLRAAFAFALAVRVGRPLGIAVSPRELGTRAALLSTAGREAVLEALNALEERRRLSRVRLAAHAAARGANPPTMTCIPRRTREKSPFDRALDALDAAGASLLDARLTQAGLDVTWRFLSQRIVSLVDPMSLRVLDAGFCLDGEDELVTLESLPSVLREGIEIGQLNVTRW
jgi:hypothetical protein